MLACRQTQGVISARNNSTVTSQGSGEIIFHSNTAKFGGEEPWLVAFGGKLGWSSPNGIGVRVAARS